MKQNETQFVIDLEGRIYRQDVNYREIDPGDALQKAFQLNLTARIRNILEIPGHGPAHMVFESATAIQYWSVPMTEIVLRTTFGAGNPGAWNEGEIFPTFAEKESGEVPMEVVWKLNDILSETSKWMGIRFVAEVASSGTRYYVRDHYLYAFDERHAAYRLPFGNIYENCRMCMGDYDSTSSTAAECVQKALTQFKRATWNADLFNNEELIQRFVRFKPLESGFKTLPILDDWTEVCAKVGTSNLKYIEI